MLSSSILQRLHHQHETITELIANADKETLNYNHAPGKWTAHDNIAHLAKYQPVFIGRIHTIINEEHPSFARYKAEDDPEFESWRNMHIQELISRLNSHRKELIELISGLNAAQLNRRAMHPRFGDLSITGWTEFFLLHEAHHLFTIFQLVNNTERK